jgi:Fuc2NAc and GlcNAc transferase
MGVVAWFLIAAYTLLAAAAGAALTVVVERQARRAAILDHPNERSLHAQPVPRGGGVAFVAVCVVGWSSLVVTGTLSARTGAGLAVPLAMLALLGWQDDRHTLAIGVRLAAQAVAAAVAIGLVGVLDPLGVGELGAMIGVVAAMLTGVWILWMVNLYNFMDGIDGIAAIQAVVASACLGAWFLIESDPGLALVCFVLSGAVGGFLYFNWCPARIFMGDAGSLFLGGFFAIVAILGSARHAIPIDAFVILLGLFIADASLTLARRMRNGERWWLPHRSHYYQRAVQTGLSHARVSTVALVLAVVLAVIATARATALVRGWWCAALAGLCLAGAGGWVRRREASAAA